ncbi:MAG: hypothetical protein WC623_07845 [Pedobacter sp.]|uniref:hypothetical protein n=1 Tax=Pedobacter sp. TaxID=1411316 RepID=UPI003566FF41
MKNKTLVTVAMILCSMYSFGQDVSKLVDTLTNRGYIIIDKDTKDLKDLERYLALDNKLTNKQDSLDNVFNNMSGYFKYARESGESDELINRIMEFARRSKEIKSYFRVKHKYASNTSFDPLKYSTFLDKYERAINGFDKVTDAKDIESIISDLKAIKNKFQQDSLIKANREIKRDSELASLPTKAAIKTKFRIYTHKTGHVFEWFPMGFTPKTGKAVIDRVFGHKARYREVDGNGMNTIVIDYYDSGNIMNVTVYGGKGGGSIYYARYRDHAKKPYEIQTYSADGKFYVVHKNTYDMYNNKTNVSTKYQYLPLDYWYE